MKLSKLQEEILHKEDERIVVMAASAAGKTRLLTEKARCLLREGINPKDIAVITFTKMAAEELRSRLGDDYKDGMFIGTIHALANKFLVTNGINTSKVLDDEKFEKLFEMVSKNPRCIQKLRYILLDEAQDSDELQFSFLLDMINPQQFFIVADLRQSIYQWAGAKPILLKNLMKKQDVACYSLNENYRNSTGILSYAKKIIQKTGLIDDSIPMRENAGLVKEVSDDIATLFPLIMRGENYGSWAILARENRQVAEIIAKLGKVKIPYDTFKQGDLKKAELTKRLQDNTVKVLTIHSSKGLEWDNVIVYGAKSYSDEEINISYVAATRARNTLFWVRPISNNYKKKDWF